MDSFYDLIHNFIQGISYSRHLCGEDIVKIKSPIEYFYLNKYKCV